MINNIGMTEDTTQKNAETKDEEKVSPPVAVSSQVEAPDSTDTAQAVAETPVEKVAESKSDDKTEKPSVTPSGPKRGSFRDSRNSGRRPGGGNRGGGRGGQRRGGARFKPEFDQKIVDIARVARVVAGGRRFSFRVSVVIGDRKGSVGVGLGKGTDTALAIEKAVKNAKKNMITVKLTENMSIPYEINAKYKSSRVIIMPAPGKGIVAGSSVRNVLDLMGAKNISAKMISRSKNKLNNARVAISAFQSLPGTTTTRLTKKKVENHPKVDQSKAEKTTKEDSKNKVVKK